MKRGRDDERFKHVSKDKRFKKIDTKKKKVIVDKRFASMLSDDKFQIASSRDRYGRSQKGKRAKLEELYDLGEAGEVEMSHQNQGKAVGQKIKKANQKKKELKDQLKRMSSSKQEDEEEVKADEDFEERQEDSEVGSGSDRDDDMEAEESDEESSEEESDSDDPRASKRRKLEGTRDNSTEQKKVGQGKTMRERMYGEGGSDSSSSSSDDESSEEDEASSDSEKIQYIEGAYKRISIIDLEWEAVTSSDLWMVVSSFLPPKGIVKSVVVYESDLGKEMIAHENAHGPPVFEVEDRDWEDWNDPVGETLNERKLRKYHAQKRKWYFAIVEFDSAETASVVYEALDGKAIEGTRGMDLRFVPEDVSFEGRRTKNECRHNPGSHYTPNTQLLNDGRFGESTGQKSTLDWDEPDPVRQKTLQRRFTQDELNELDFAAYLASSESSSFSSSDDDSEDDNDARREKRKKKYQSLLAGIQEEEDDNGVVGDMEVTFTSGLSEKAADLLKKKEKERWEKDATVFEKKMAAQKEKKKKKRAHPAADEDEDMDHYGDDIPAGFEKFDEEELLGGPDVATGSKKSKRKQKAHLPEMDKKSKAALDLLMMDPLSGKSGHDEDSEEDTLALRQKMTKKKRKKLERQMKAKETAEAGEKVLKDDRFAALVSDHRFARDPTSSHFDPSSATNQRIQDERKSRKAVSKKHVSNDDDIRSMISNIKKHAKPNEAIKKSEKKKIPSKARSKKTTSVKGKK